MVLIGIDPHKGSHTAVVIDRHETKFAELRVRSSKQQCARLLEWASVYPQRRWAVESAAGLGYLLAQQLVAAGEDVVDVPPMLASRVRVLGSGKAQKNDRTTPCRPPLPRCAAGVCAMSSSTTTQPSSGCSPTAITTWPPCTPRPSADSTRCWQTSLPAAFWAR